ncbi:hypothetical protein BT63DRAFT_246054 [Microthyrium microscopicum]|uniref:Uncharacterized protein n=1 Tax=Microthyrium microscopicum TaxID=703497 RepID=A0A6A6UBG4_9PEZI|nr:hypothetical protein BT63DRAFT_246054 [Microthyrium microscopicum]
MVTAQDVAAISAPKQSKRFSHQKRGDKATDDTAECCYPAVNSQGAFCRDGTVGTPYCGIGPCNEFGCNCEYGT